MKILNIVILILIVISLSGCTKSVEPDQVPGDIVLTQKSAELISADNSFTFKLLNKIPANSTKNVMVSPLSISLALSMALNGAETTTKTSIINTLGFSGLSVDEINQIYLDLITALKQADPKVVMNVANSIWIKKSYPVLDPFLTTNQKYFDATITRLVFDLTALNTINGWVNEKTNSKIPKILDQISADEIMFLINAIYFNGQWKIQFDKTKTLNETFTLSSGGSVSAPMMKGKELFGYSVQTGYKALKMTYGRGKFGMTLLLPDDGKTPEQILSQLTPSAFVALENTLSTTVKTDVWLPKFKFSYDIDLKEILSALGMSIAFVDGQADFSKINSTDKLFITKVKHKTFIDVNEEGTEAAAVTSIGIGVTSIGPSEPIFHATKPFLFFITEEDTQAIIFTGKVENPLIAE
ncbi:MAG: serpin family protein [Mariniphaga sp.]